MEIVRRRKLLARLLNKVMLKVRVVKKLWDRTNVGNQTFPGHKTISGYKWGF